MSLNFGQSIRLPHGALSLLNYIDGKDFAVTFMNSSHLNASLWSRCSEKWPLQIFYDVGIDDAKGITPKFQWLKIQPLELSKFLYKKS